MKVPASIIIYIYESMSLRIGASSAARSKNGTLTEGGPYHFE
jgi:hypothetical protein